LTTSSPAEQLVGGQRPRVELVPEYVSSAGEEAVDFCTSIGLHLDPWQRHVVRESLGERRDGKYAAFEVAVLVPRQNGKGAILEARELAGLFLFGEGLILHSAHEFKTAQEAFRRVLAHVENASDLRKRVARVRTSHGEEGIELKSGARLRFVARSTGSGRGFSGDTVILDEAYNLASEGMSALLPTLSARPNPQIWYTSSAGMASSDQLRRVRERGLAGESKRLAYFEWSAPADVDLDDRAAWAQANPALGIRITEEFIESERDAMDDTGFSRERLGIWFDPSAQMVIDGRKWAALADLDSRIDGPRVFAVDATPERSGAAIAVAGRRKDGLGHVEVADMRSGTGWVVDRVVELHQRHKPRAWVLDPASAAGAWIPALQERGIEPVLITGREMAQACGALYEDVVENGALRHIDQPQLNAALSGARKRHLSDAWAWHRRDSTVDISPLVAVTLAWHGVATHGAPEKRSAYEDDDLVVV
jgi:phage terminase large subunit-like protein